MPGNLSKAEAKRRLADAIRNGQKWVCSEVAAAVFDLSGGTFEKWVRDDPNAPQSQNFGRRKTYRLSDALNHPGPGKRQLDDVPHGDAGSEGARPANDPIMESIHAARDS